MKMRADFADLSHCAVPFLSRAADNLYWYYCTHSTCRQSFLTHGDWRHVLSFRVRALFLKFLATLNVKLKRRFDLML